MITVKVDDRNWLQFQDGTPKEVINKRITEWIKNRESSRRKEIKDLKDDLSTRTKGLSYSEELSRLRILNRYKIVI